MARTHGSKSMWKKVGKNTWRLYVGNKVLVGVAKIIKSNSHYDCHVKWNVGWGKGGTIGRRFNTKEEGLRWLSMQRKKINGVVFG